MKKLLFAALTVALLLAQPQSSQADKRKRQDMRAGVNIGDPNGTVIKQLRFGVATFVAGVATVADPAITSTAAVFASRNVVAGTSGVGIAVAITPGTGFTLTSQTAGALTTQAGDTSAVAWMVVQP
jgi:hypothetical protein